MPLFREFDSGSSGKVNHEARWPRFELESAAALNLFDSE
jgi:hypothetical protein